MGIKFLCPNGHKLNVKTFLAGKKAICPKCGAKVIVPGTSTGDDQGEGGDAAGLAAGTGMAGAPPGHPLGGVGAPLQPNLNPLQPGSPASAPATAMIDPIDEAPTAVWYVRPPSGGQYGPAAGPTMRAWIQEGRVTANSLVWRDGWPEWRSAAATFPSLAAPQQPAWGGTAAPGGFAPSAQPSGMAQPMAPAGMPMAGWQPGAAAPVAPGGFAASAQPGGMAPVAMPMVPQGGVPLGHVMSALETPLAGYDAPADDEFSSRSRRRRTKKGPDITTYVAVALVVMTVVLVVVLAIVLVKQRSATEEAAPSGAAAQSEESSDDAPEMQGAKSGDDQAAAEGESPPAKKKSKKSKAKAAEGDEKM